MSRKPSLNIAALMRRGESEEVEFKESFGRDAIETVCAFANTSGGTVLIGVNDKGQATGTHAARTALKDWSNQIAQGTDIHPSIKTVTHKGKVVIVIRVQESKIKPVLFQGRAYRRVGSTTRQMGVEDIVHAALSHIGVTWDAMPEPRAKLSDISIPKVRAFIKMANREKRRPVPAGTSPTELLRKLELVREGKLTRAAILLFGKNPQSFYSEAMLKIGRFRNETLIVDDRRIDGTLFDQVEGAMGYFREKLDTRYVMTGRPQREVIWEYPLKALREAVTNAICHRKYMSLRDTEIRIYDREILVWNDGGLPAGLSVQALKKKHPSLPRNKQIAEIFYYAGMIERWGGGTQMIIRECAIAGHPDPVFEQEMGLKVTFRKPVEQATPHVAPHDTPHVTPHVIKLLKAARKSLSRDELQKVLGHKDRRTFQRAYIDALIAAGWLAMTFPDKPKSRRQRYRTTPAGAVKLKEK